MLMKTWLSYPELPDRCETEQTVIDTLLRKGWITIQAPPEPEPSPPEIIAVPGAAFFQAIGRDMEIRLRAKIAEEPDLNQRHFMASFLSYPYFESNHPMVLQFGALLGKSPEEIRGYFEQAKAIAYP